MDGAGGRSVRQAGDPVCDGIRVAPGWCSQDVDVCRAGCCEPATVQEQHVAE